MSIALNDEIRRLLDGPNYAVLATINPDGGPQTSAMWAGRDGDDVLFSTVAGRRKHRNLERGPRASVSLLDSEGAELRRAAWPRDDRAGRRTRVRHRPVVEVRRARPRSGSSRRGQADPAHDRREGDGVRRVTPPGR